MNRKAFGANFLYFKRYRSLLVKLVVVDNNEKISQKSFHLRISKPTSNKVYLAYFYLLPGSIYFLHFNMRHPGLTDSQTDCEMGNDSGKRRLRVRDKRPYLVLLLPLGFISKTFGYVVVSLEKDCLNTCWRLHFHYILQTTICRLLKMNQNEGIYWTPKYV